MKKLRLISLLAAAAVTQGLCTAVNAENLNTAQIRGKDALTALLSSAGAADPDAETAQICAILSQAGIDDVSSLINPGTPLTSVGQSDCKDLNDDGVFDAVDSMYILHFLQGKKNYQHAYSDMDANHDDIIDQTDAYCYTEYYVKMLALGYSSGNIPYSAHNTGSAPTVASESRTYIKHAAADGVNPSSNDVFYTLGTSNYAIPTPSDWFATYATEFLESINETSSNDSESDIQTRTNDYTVIQDSRVIRSNGTGAIIGEHIILTNAHCVYNRDTGNYVYTDYCAFTYSSDNKPIRHDLSVVSYHIPELYVSSTTGYIQYDYALVVVSDDLSDYGSFTLGAPLDTAYSHQKEVYIESFPQEYPCYTVEPDDYPVNWRYRKYLVKSEGYITGADEEFIWSNARTANGSSGAPILCSTSYQSGSHQPIYSYDVQIAIMRGSGFGPRIIRPILRFCFDNPFL